MTEKVFIGEKGASFNDPKNWKPLGVPEGSTVEEPEEDMRTSDLVYRKWKCNICGKTHGGTPESNPCKCQKPKNYFETNKNLIIPFTAFLIWDSNIECFLSANNLECKFIPKDIEQAKQDYITWLQK